MRQGLATTKPVIKIEGVAELSETAVTMIARDAIILADAGALMRRSNSGPILRVTDDLTVSISGLGLGGTAGGITDAALVASNPTELALHHVFITGNSQVGLKVTGGKLVMDGCIVVGNVNGGLDADATMLDITSSMFVSNGQTGSVTAFGAVQAANVQAGSRFAFNTIAGNTANVAKTDGIACSTALEIVSTIVHDDVTSGACTYSKSLVPPATACTGCVTGDPKFASTNVSDPRAADFFRLKPGSPAIAAGAPVAGIHLDIDGDPRPTTTPDIGADQYTP